MAVVSEIAVSAGTRIGYWQGRFDRAQKGPFDCIGFYYGPDLGGKIPGEKIRWPLISGDLIMRVGVLFRPDLGKRQKLETILILEKYQEEMWDYDDFQQEAIG